MTLTYIYLSNILLGSVDWDFSEDIDAGGQSPKFNTILLFKILKVYWKPFLNRLESRNHKVKIINPVT